MGLRLPLGLRVVVAYEDGHGIIGPELIRSLNPSSSLSFRSSSVLHLPLKPYDSTLDAIVEGEIITFSSSKELPQVSFILLKDMPKPINVYSAHAVLKFVMENAPVDSPEFLLLFPSAAFVPGSFWINKPNSISKDPDYYVFKALQKGTSECQRDVFMGLPHLPPTMQINDENTSNLLHFAKLLDCAVALLFVPLKRVSVLDKSSQDEVKKRSYIIRLLGETMADQLGLSYSGIDGSQMPQAPSPKNCGNEEWRSLYI